MNWWPLWTAALSALIGGLIVWRRPRLVFKKVEPRKVDARFPDQYRAVKEALSHERAAQSLSDFIDRRNAQLEADADASLEKNSASGEPR